MQIGCDVSPFWRGSPPLSGARATRRRNEFVGRSAIPVYAGNINTHEHSYITQLTIADVKNPALIGVTVRAN